MLCCCSMDLNFLLGINWYENGNGMQLDRRWQEDFHLFLNHIFFLLNQLNSVGVRSALLMDPHKELVRNKWKHSICFMPLYGIGEYKHCPIFIPQATKSWSCSPFELRWIGWLLFTYISQNVIPLVCLFCFFLFTFFGWDTIYDYRPMFQCFNHIRMIIINYKTQSKIEWTFTYTHKHTKPHFYRELPTRLYPSLFILVCLKFMARGFLVNWWILCATNYTLNRFIIWKFLS